MRRHINKKLKISVLSILIFIGAAFIFAAINKWPAVSPKEKNGVTSQENISIKEEKAFSKPVPFGGEITVGSAEVLKTRRKAEASDALANLVLRGTVSWDTEYARAIIENISEKEQGIYKIGDIVNNGTIRMIKRKWVVINFGGRDMTLAMTASSRSEESSGRIVTIAASELKTIFADTNNWMSQVRIRPYVSDAGTGGLRIDTIAPGSIFEKLGFTEGDIIEEINGAKIKRPRMLTALFEGAKLLPAKMFSMEGFGSKAESVLLKLDSQSGGIGREVSKLYQKVKSGEDIPILFTRNGISQTRIFKVQ